MLQRQSVCATRSDNLTVKVEVTVTGEHPEIERADLMAAVAGNLSERKNYDPEYHLMISDVTTLED